jgi:hypothetical protein
LLLWCLCVTVEIDMDRDVYPIWNFHYFQQKKTKNNSTFCFSKWISGRLDVNSCV